MIQITPPEQARSDILSSGLSSTTQRNALALLARAHPHNGHLTISWESLLDLFGLAHRGAARRYLTRLMETGVIHYSTNAQVFVTFSAWSHAPNQRVGAPNQRVGAPNQRVDAPNQRVDAPNQRVDAPTGEDSENPSARPRAESARGRAESARGRAAKSAYKEYMFVCLFVDPLSTSLEEILNKQTNKQRAAYALLTDPDIAIAELLAADIAAGIDAPAGGYDLDYIQRQVFAWLRDLESGRVTSAGALITRIRRGFQARAITDDDRTTALWQRHFPDDRPTDPSYEWDDLIIR